MKNTDTHDRFGVDALNTTRFNTGRPFAGGFGELNNIFNTFHGGSGCGFGGTRHDPNAPERGDDLRLDIEIDFDPAIFGMNKEIKSAFRKKARQYQPDVNKAPDAEEKFKELGEAYETLMDENKGDTYERFGEDGLKNAGLDNGGP